MGSERSEDGQNDAAKASDLRLQRITTAYSATQDRIRLAGALPGGAPVVLWLTQRLVRRLLPPLLDWLEQQGGLAQAAGGGRPLYAEALQAFAQQAARAQMVPQAPVQATQDCPAWLVETLDLTSSTENVRLVFKLPQQGAVATMALQAQPLRQWLGVLYDAWCQADWPLDGWPDWLRESALAAAPQPGRALH